MPIETLAIIFRAWHQWPARRPHDNFGPSVKRGQVIGGNGICDQYSRNALEGRFQRLVRVNVLAPCTLFAGRIQVYTFPPCALSASGTDRLITDSSEIRFPRRKNLRSGYQRMIPSSVAAVLEYIAISIRRMGIPPL